MRSFIFLLTAPDPSRGILFTDCDDLHVIFYLCLLSYLLRIMNNLNDLWKNEGTTIALKWAVCAIVVTLLGRFLSTMYYYRTKVRGLVSTRREADM